MINKIKNSIMLRRVTITIFFLSLYKIGSCILLPLIDKQAILEMNPTTLSSIATLSGASLDSFSILALGISPYILSSMAIQILCMFLPTMKKMQKEGRDGKKKIERITTICAIFLAFFQGYILIYSRNQTYEILPNSNWQTIAILAFLLTIGTMASIWIAQEISLKGLGNGTSVLILMSISEGMFKNFYTGYSAVAESSSISDAWSQLAIYGLLWIAALMITIIIELLQKPYKMRYNIGSGKEQISYYHIRLNNAGIMPLLFASILQTFISSFNWNIPEWVLYVGMFFIVIVFTYIYTYQSINPKETAEDLQYSHVYFDRIATQKQTEQFLQKQAILITGLNAIVLLIYMILPTIVNLITKMEIGNFIQIGGTTLLVFISIIVQVYDSLTSTRTELKIEKIV